MMEQATHKADKLATYVVIYVLLMLLLVATVIAGSIDLGVWNTVIALAIAVLKAILVVLFFMHVRHSSRMTCIFSGAAIVWLGFLIALTLTDYTTRDRPIPSSAAKITYPTIPASLSGDR